MAAGEPFHVVNMRLSAEGFMTFIKSHELEISSDQSRWRFYVPLHTQVIGCGGCELYRIVSTLGPVFYPPNLYAERRYCL